jgi:putative LysE/RhtB family amino acid efflux pump
MWVILFLKGALLGIIITAPPGPIGTLCINRTLERGFWAGAALGLGTALGDASYALVAVGGLAIFANVLASIAMPLAFGGGLLLIWLGYRSLYTDPIAAAQIGATDLFRTSLATFFLTISNPATIISFGALFAAFGLAHENSAASAAFIVGGAFSGSIAWWLFLSGMVRLARKKLSDDFAAKVGRISAYLLIGFGAVALVVATYALVR